MKRVLLWLLCCAVITSPSWGQQPDEPAADEAAICQTAAAYAVAYNKHDAQALADHWTPEAVYRNRTTGCGLRTFATSSRRLRGP